MLSDCFIDSYINHRPFSTVYTWIPVMPFSYENKKVLLSITCAQTKGNPDQLSVISGTVAAVHLCHGKQTITTSAGLLCGFYAWTCKRHQLKVELLNNCNWQQAFNTLLHRTRSIFSRFWHFTEPFSNRETLKFSFTMLSSRITVKPDRTISL